YAVLDRSYGRMLQWSLAHRAVMLGIAGLVAASAVILFPRVGKELVPEGDQGDFNINIRLPRGTSYAPADEFIRPSEEEIVTLPALRRVRTNINPGFANFGIMLVPLEERTVSQNDLIRRSRALLRKYQGVRTSVSGNTDISGASGGGGGPGGGGGGGNRLN